ncbi:hypothetical protein GCM10027425_21840 [Alteromonas gracilis]
MSNDPARTSVSRRRVVAGAAWAVPTAVVATSAPAFAVSATCQTVPLMTAANGWTSSSVNMSGNGGLFGFAGVSGYEVVADPGSTGAASITVTSPTTSFVVGRSYVFTFTYRVVSSNPRGLLMSLEAAGQTLAGASLNSDTTTPANGTRSVTYTPTVASTGTVRLLFTFPAGANSTVGDDIYISNFSATCV